MQLHSRSEECISQEGARDSKRISATAPHPAAAPKLRAGLLPPARVLEALQQFTGVALENPAFFPEVSGFMPSERYSISNELRLKTECEQKHENMTVKTDSFKVSPGRPSFITSKRCAADNTVSGGVFLAEKSGMVSKETCSSLRKALAEVCSLNELVP